MQVRYSHNIDEIYDEDFQNNLLTKNIGVIGCGGQGGYILEFLARLGVHSITFWDGDKYEESNINRQIGCIESTIGQNKALVLLDRLKNINSSIIYNCCDWYFGDNIDDLTKASEVDFIFMAADHNYNVIPLRRLVRQLILKDIPVIECPVGLLGGFVTILSKKTLDFFDSRTKFLISLSGKKPDKCSDAGYKCALMSAEAINQMMLYFNDSEYANTNSMLSIDIYHHRYIQEDKYGIFKEN